MDVSLLIKERLRELRLDQKDLARAAQVTDSYVSQLLSRKKAPPAPGRTDIYEKIGQFLKLPAGQLAALADAQRQQELKRRVAAPPQPLFRECRVLILGKCVPERRAEMRRVFEKEAFGEFERLITQKILDVAQGIAREELRNEEWLRSLALLSGRTFEQMRVAVLEFLDTDVLHISNEGCTSFLDPMINSWDFGLRSFALEIVMNPRLAPGSHRRFEFVETTFQEDCGMEPGFEEFLNDKALSRDASAEEIAFLKQLKFGARRPSSLYYYRELQSLKDPLHFDRKPATEELANPERNASESR